MNNYNNLIDNLRIFFNSLGYKEYIQSNYDKNIISKCDIMSINVQDAIMYNTRGIVSHLPQSSHTLLKLELLKMSCKGLYTITNVYRMGEDFENTTDNIYPLFEFVSYGCIDDLMNLHVEFCNNFFNKSYVVINTCNNNVICDSTNKIIILKGRLQSDNEFPLYKYSHDDDMMYKTIDMYIDNKHIIDSGERDENYEQVIYDNIIHDKHIKYLFSIFSKKRIEDEFVNIKKLFQHCWIKGGINILSLLDVYKKLN